MTQEASVAVPGMNLTWGKLAGILGILGVVFFVIGGLLQGDTPFPDATAAEIGDWYADNGNRYLIGNFIITLAVVLGLLPFFCYLRVALAEAEGGPAMGTRIAFLGAVLFLVMGAVQSMPFGVLASDPGIKDDTLLVTLNTLGWYSAVGVSVTLIPFFLGVGLTCLRGASLPTLLGWLSLALAVCSIIASAAMLDLKNDVFVAFTLISFIGLAIVILTLSVSFIRRPA